MLKLSVAGGASLAGSIAGLSRPGPSLAATTITSWAISGPRFEFPQSAVAKVFERRFPGNRISMTTSGWGEFYQKVAVALSSGSTQYDVIQHDYVVVPALAGAGWLEPLDDYLEKDKDFKESVERDIPKNVLDLYRYKGKLYGIPPDANTQMMYYRADVLSKRGIKPPGTWDQALEAAKELTGGKQYGFVGSLRRGFWGYLYYLSMIRSYGGNLFDQKFAVMVNSDPGFKALTMLKNIQKYGDPVGLNGTNDEVIKAFSGEAGVFAPCEWGGAGFTNQKFNKFAEATSSEIVPAGTGRGAAPVPDMGGLGLIMPAKSLQKAAAWQWIKFVNSDNPEVVEAWVKNAGQPARLSALRSPKYNTVQPFFATLAKSLTIAKPYGGFPEHGAVEELVGTEVSVAVTGQKSVETALKDMEKGLKEIFTNAGYYK
jgi:multiple sugar transport system substrate-binding protein